MASIEILASAQRSASGVGDALDLTTPQIIGVTLVALHPEARKVRPTFFAVTLEQSHDGVTWRPLYEFREHDRLPTHEALLDNLSRSLMVGAFRAVLPCDRYVRAAWTLAPRQTPSGSISDDGHNVLEFGIAGDSGAASP